jgi:hypothetical protein
MNLLGRFALPCAAAYIDGVAPRLNPKSSGPDPENGMKTKTFTGNAPGAVIKAVNDWLVGETGVTIRRTETRETEPQDGSARLTFEIWYDQDAR